MSMNCKKAEEYLVDYLYQELPAKKTLEIEKHLQTCKHCTKTLESWRAIHRAYQRNAEEPQIAPYFKQKILAIAEEELSRSPSWTERFSVGLKFATIPIAIFVIVLFLNQTDRNKMAMNKPQEKTVSPAVVPEVAQDTRQLQTPAARERKQDSITYGGKRSEADSLNKLKARPYDEALDKDVAEKNTRMKEEEARRDAPASGMTGTEVPPAAPAPAASVPQAQQEYAAESDYGQSKSEPMPAKKVSAISKQNAEEPFQKAQQELNRGNMKGWQDNVQQAVSLDDQKTLARSFDQEGQIYQSRGEFGKAIPNYEQVQSNYRDYPQKDEVLLRLGDSYAEIGEYVKAVRSYQQVSPSQQRVARERIQRLQKKQEAQQQLKALGYTSDKE